MWQYYRCDDINNKSNWSYNNNGDVDESDEVDRGARRER